MRLLASFQLNSLYCILSVQYLLQTARQELGWGQHTRLQCVPAHRGIMGNELADRTAKQGAYRNASVRLRLLVENRLLIMKNRKKEGFQSRLLSAVIDNNIATLVF